MTNHFTDMANSKAFLVFSNPAENHPGCLQFINDARRNNSAKVFVVDPRKTRMTAVADLYLRIRPGTDTALINGLIKHAIDNNKYDETYLDSGRGFTTNPTDARYKLNTSRTDYERDGSGAPVTVARTNADSVWTFLTDRVSGYTSATVAAICGCTESEFDVLARTVNNYGGVSNPLSIAYAMGTTQHTYGSQTIRAYAIYQTIMGNMGVAGGGVNALRGIANVQGSTDMGVLYDSIPAYSGNPGARTNLAAGAASGATTISVYSWSGFKVGQSIRIGAPDSALSGTISAIDTSGTGPYTFTVSALTGAAAAKSDVWWIQGYGHYENRLFGAVKSSTYTGYGAPISTSSAWNGWQQVGYTSLIHHWFRQRALPPDAEYSSGEDNYNHDLVPKGNGYDHRTMFVQASTGNDGYKSNKPQVKAMYVVGQNPMVTEGNSSLVRQGLYDLDLLVVQDMFETETAAVSRNASGETFLLPAASFAEKCGTITNSGRWIQWKDAAILPKGNCKPDSQILLELAKKLEGAGAFSHITSGGSTDIQTGHFADLYYNTAKSGYGYDPGVTAPNDGSSYPQSTVVENIHKQMAAWVGSGNAAGTVWIYGSAYQSSMTGTVRAGTTLTAAAAVGDATVTVASTGGMATGMTAQVGLFGANEEERTITGISGLGITLNSGLTYAHATGEPFTPRGFWSHHASGGFLTKSRSSGDLFGRKVYPRFAFSWLVNRRTFYNYNKCSEASVDSPSGLSREAAGGTGITNTNTGNRYCPGYIEFCAQCGFRPIAYGGDGQCPEPSDARDFFVAPDNKARIFVHKNTTSTAVPPQPTPTIEALSSSAVFRYRNYSTLSEDDGATPKHWEPHETPKPNLLSAYGKVGVNSVSNYADTVAERTEFPLTLTTFRHTEHFQGGPMTRNIPLLNELVPNAIVELNSGDAGDAGILPDGNVYIMTLRSCKKTKVATGGYSGGTTLNVDSYAAANIEVGDYLLVGDGTSVRLTANAGATTSTLTVTSTTGINADDKILVGAGGANVEEIQVNTASGTTITLKTSLVGDHVAGEWVNKEEAKVKVEIAGNSLTLASALRNQHSAGTYVYNVGSPQGASPTVAQWNNKGWIGPWKAFVGTGSPDNQRVGVGVVGVPWHWGKKSQSLGFSEAPATGPTANELCTDAQDDNTKMPETKVALCKIKKG